MAGRLVVPLDFATAAEETSVCWAGVEAAGAGVAADGVACWALTGGLNKTSATAEALARQARRKKRDIVSLILTPQVAHGEQPRIERKSGHCRERPRRKVQVRIKGDRASSTPPSG